MNPCVLIYVVLALAFMISIPAEVRADPETTEEIRLTSRFADFRNNNEVFQGYDRSIGQWVDIPFSLPGEELSKEEIARTWAIPNSGPIVPFGKEDLLFSDSFETDTCPYCPSGPEYLEDGDWQTFDWSYDPVNNDDGETVWGRTCSKAFSGQSSVWCSKVKG